MSHQLVIIEPQWNTTLKPFYTKTKKVSQHFEFLKASLYKDENIYGCTGSNQRTEYHASDIDSITLWDNMNFLSYKSCA